MTIDCIVPPVPRINSHPMNSVKSVKETQGVPLAPVFNGENGIITVPPHPMPSIVEKLSNVLKLVAIHSPVVRHYSLLAIWPSASRHSFFKVAALASGPSFFRALNNTEVYGLLP